MNLEKYFTGATIPHIYFKDYKNEEFNFDFWERQVEIVSVLSKCEKVIDLCKQELQLLDKLIKARFVEMFGDVIHNSKKMASLFICRDHFFTIGEMLDAKLQTGRNSYPYLANFNVQWFRFNLEKSK